jgi:hypothetical protein
MSPVAISSALLVLTVPLAAASAGTADRLAIRVEAAENVVVRGVELGEIRSLLASGLGGKKSFRVVAADETPELVAEIVECTLGAERRTSTELVERPLLLPVGKGVGRGGEREVAVASESHALVRLKVRIASGPRSFEIVSGPKDRKLKEAVGTVVAEAERAVRERRAWLIAR